MLPPSDAPPPGELTTVMLRNLPNNYTRAMLCELLDSEGFARQYDFMYLPIDFKSRASLGYAFVNLVSPSVAERFRDTFNGYSKWLLPSRKVCGVNWSGPHQGLAAHIERYRNSPVMHEAVPDPYKPIILSDGVRIPFPLPTRSLRQPRIRHHQSASAEGVDQSTAAAEGGSSLAGAPATAPPPALPMRRGAKGGGAAQASRQPQPLQRKGGEPTR